MNSYNRDNYLINCDNIPEYTLNSFNAGYNTECQHEDNYKRYPYLCGKRTQLYQNKGGICVANKEDCENTYLSSDYYFKLPCKNIQSKKVSFKEPVKSSMKKPKSTTQLKLSFSTEIDKKIQKIEQEINKNKKISEIMNKEQKYYNEKTKKNIRTFLDKYKIYDEMLRTLLKGYLVEAEAYKVKYLETLQNVKDTKQTDKKKGDDINYNLIVKKGKLLTKEMLLKYNIEKSISNISIYLYQNILYFIDNEEKKIINTKYTYQFIIKHGKKIEKNDNQLLYNFLRYKFQGIDENELPDELESITFTPIKKDGISYYKYEDYIYILDTDKENIIYQEPTVYLLKLKGIFIELDKLDESFKTLYSVKKEDKNYLYNNKVYIVRLNMIIHERNAY